MRFDFWKDGETRRSVLTCLLLALPTIAVYWQIGSFDFTHYDEFFMITNNPVVRAGLTLDGVRWALTTSWFEYWHPVTWLSFMLDCELFGLRTGYHHLMNLAFHTANTVLVFLVLYRLTRAYWRSAIVAALFALHPLHVESVAWAAERKDVLSGLFFLLTLWAYARYAEEWKTKSSQSNSWYVASLVFFALGLMSKPMLITLPFVLLLLDYWPLNRLEINTALPRLSEKLPFFALTIASTAISYWGVQAGGNILSADAVPWGLRLANVPVSYARYLINMVWPVNLAILYPLPNYWPVWQVAGALALVVGVSVLALVQARSTPYLLVGWFIFLGVLFPTIGLVQAGLQSIADRYTYIPSIGLFLAVVWGLGDCAQKWHQRPPLVGGMVALVLAACGFMTWRQAAYWRDGLTLWTHCVAVTSEENVTGVFNRGYALQLEGKDDDALKDYRKIIQNQPEHPQANRNDYLYANLNLGAILVGRGQMAEATNYFQRALQLRPDEPKAHANLGLALRELGDLNGAITQCAEAIRLDPGEFAPFFDMGLALSALGQRKEAIYYLSEALRRNPGAAQLHFHLGSELLRAGEAEPAIASLGEAVRLAPGWPEAHLQLADALTAKGDPTEAAAQYREAIRLKPSLTAAVNNLAWILATCPDGKLRDGPEAVRLAEQACEQTAWKETFLIGTLSAAYAETGQFEKAVEISRKACELADTLGQTNLLARNRQFLLKFQSHEPYREPKGD